MQPTLPWSDRLDAAARLLQDHRAAEAIPLLEGCVGEDGTAAAFGLLGDAYFFTEDYARAEAAYRTALERAPGVGSVEDKLVRTFTNRVTDIGGEEQQVAIFRRLFTADHALGGPHPGAPASRMEQAPEFPEPPAPKGLAGLFEGLESGLGKVVSAIGTRVFHGLTEAAGEAGVVGETWTTWHHTAEGLPEGVRTPLQILKLAWMRESLFANNLVRPYADGVKTGFWDTEEGPPAWARHWRTADGSWNDLRKDADGKYDPLVGAAYTRFFRNVGDDVGLESVRPRPNPATNPVSVRELSRHLLAPKGPRKEVPFLNLWAGAWIQFMVHDWVSHGTPNADHVDSIPLAPDDPIRARYPIDRLTVRTSWPDPTRRPEDGDRPPTTLNEVTHWWDGSQLYGSDDATQQAVRAHVGGRLRLTAEGLLEIDPATNTEITGFSRNWWVGLAMLHTLFTREHNAICARLAEAYPTWDDERLFQTARLVNAAVMAKIHTIEWTPGILANRTLHDAMNANWFGLLTNWFGGKDKKALEEVPVTNRELGGLIGNPQGDFARYGLSEEFTAVYRLHSLLPDAVRLPATGPGSKGPGSKGPGSKGPGSKPASAAGAEAPSAPIEIPLAQTRHAAVKELLREHGALAFAHAMGVQSPGALVNNNFPAVLLEMSAPGAPLMDLGAIDLYRDRERGVPPYNQLRAELGLPRVASFDILTEDPEAALTLRRLYGVDAEGRDNVDAVDLLIGTLCEGNRPAGFGFGETLFQVFILNASWRLLGDRFYTDDYRPEIYTPEGIAWIDAATMKSVLLRHHPELEETGLGNVRNAFEPWDEGRLDPARHPLRGFEADLKDDPWSGERARGGSLGELPHR